jgi:hypothetical protein
MNRSKILSIISTTTTIFLLLFCIVLIELDYSNDNSIVRIVKKCMANTFILLWRQPIKFPYKVFYG